MAESLVYGSGPTVARLRGNSGEILTLNKGGPLSLQWAPEDKRATDLEIRAQIVDFQPFNSAAPTSPPDVRFSLDFGHGKNSYTLPFLPGFFAAGTALAAFFSYSVPARGMVLRIAARELKITFQTLSKISVPNVPYDKTSIAVSFVPTSGMSTPIMPSQLYAPSGFLINRFPVEAKEWRLSDAAGRPFAPAATTFGILDLSLQAIALGLDPAQWADYRPIPHDGFFWGSAASAIYATFR